jgi:hypothetical protein
MNPKDKLDHLIRAFLEERGIDALYGGTILCILITLSYWRMRKNWNNLPGWRQRIMITNTFATIVLILISLLRLLGIFNF